MRLLHGNFCSAAHKEAYFQSMDRLGLERLIAAQPPRANNYQPCTKPVNFESLVQPEAVQIPATPKTLKPAPRVRPHLELAQGGAAVVGV